MSQEEKSLSKESCCGRRDGNSQICIVNINDYNLTETKSTALCKGKKEFLDDIFYTRNNVGRFGFRFLTFQKKS